MTQLFRKLALPAQTARLSSSYNRLYRPCFRNGSQWPWTWKKKYFQHFRDQRVKNQHHLEVGVFFIPSRLQKLIQLLTCIIWRSNDKFWHIFILTEGFAKVWVKVQRLSVFMCVWMAGGVALANIYALEILRFVLYVKILKRFPGAVRTWYLRFTP